MIILIVKIYSEKKKANEENSVKLLKVSKVLLNERTANQISKQVKIKVSVLNTLKWLSISKLFRLQEIFKTSLRLIERWFTSVADSEDFLELDFKSVAAILNSSELLIDSELQVFNAMNAWLNHKSIERSKHAKYLLQRVRLSLLTVPALNNMVDKNMWIVKDLECFEVIKKTIINKKESKSSKALSNSRHCSQDSFNFVVVCGRRNFQNKYTAVSYMKYFHLIYSLVKL